MSKQRSQSKSQRGQYRAIAEYYDAEYETNDVLDNDVPTLLAHLPKRSQRVLELCCGTARAAIPVAQAGHRVVGFDIDDALLDIARRKREGAGLTDAQLTLICADALKFDLQEEFDWAFLIFNTLLNFTTADSQDALLANTVRHLKPGGKLWIDIFNPDLSILSIPYAPHFDSASFYVPSLDRCVHRVTSLRQSEKVPQLQHMAFQYTWADAAGELQTKSVQFDMTWMFPRELTRLLERHGLRVDQVYGDYDGSDVTPASPRLIALATKLK